MNANLHLVYLTKTGTLSMGICRFSPIKIQPLVVQLHYMLPYEKLDAFRNVLEVEKTKILMLDCSENR